MHHSFLFNTNAFQNLDIPKRAWEDSCPVQGQEAGPEAQGPPRSRTLWGALGTSGRGQFAWANYWSPERAKEARAGTRMLPLFGVWMPNSALSGRCPSCCVQNTSLPWGCEQQGAGGAEAFLSYDKYQHFFLSSAPSPSLRRDQLTWAGSPHIQAPLPKPIYWLHFKRLLNESPSSQIRAELSSHAGAGERAAQWGCLLLLPGATTSVPAPGPGGFRVSGCAGPLGDLCPGAPTLWTVIKLNNESEVKSLKIIGAAASLGMQDRHH